MREYTQNDLHGISDTTGAGSEDCSHHHEGHNTIPKKEEECNYYASDRWVGEPRPP
jgi:hypothetical protein